MNAQAQRKATEPTFSEIVAANVRAIAGLRGITQAQLADRIAMSRSSMNHRWNGARQWQLEDLDAVAGVLDVMPWELCVPMDYDNRPQRKLRPISSLYTARDSNPEPADSGRLRFMAPVVDFDSFLKRRVAS